MSIQFGPEWEQFEARLNAFPQNLERNMRQTMTTSLLNIERDARLRAPRDRGRLQGSITHRIDGQFPNLVGQVGPSVQYGAPVEFGAHYPGKGPPPQALLSWVRRHWAPRSNAAQRRIQAARFPGRQRNAEWRRAGEQQLMSQARYLSRLIRQRGLPARPYLRPAYERNLSAIEAAFARMGARVVAQLAGGSQT